MTSQRTMSQVRSILSKLDRTRSASRGRPAGAAPGVDPVGHVAAETTESAPIDSDTLIGAPKSATPAPRIAPTPADPGRPGAQFGRAKPIPSRG